jgi:hypothetical protein
MGRAATRPDWRLGLSFNFIHSHGKCGASRRSIVVVAGRRATAGSAPDSGNLGVLVAVSARIGLGGVVVLLLLLLLLWLLLLLLLHNGVEAAAGA